MKLSPREHNLDDVFRDRLKDLEAQPSELPWFGIDANLPGRNVFAEAFRTLSGAMATVAIVSFSVAAFLNDVSPSRILAAHEAVRRPAASATENFVSTQPEIPASSVLIVNTDASAAHDAVLPHQAAMTPAPSVGFVKSLGTEALPADQISLETPDLTLGSVEVESAHGFRIGGLAGVNNTWLFAQPDAPASSEIAGYTPTLGGSVGVSVAYDFTPSAGIEVDIICSSSEGQSYDLVSEEGQTTTQVKVNYLRIPVLYKKRFTQNSELLNTAVSINYLAGLQYGRLNWVNADPEHQVLEESDLNKQELGVVVGLEYDIYFAQNYVLTLGGRAAVNNDLSAFPFFMSDEYAERANFSVGAQVKLSYILAR